MRTTNPKIDAYFKRIHQWQRESEKLRTIALGFPLTEEMKWGKPCYAWDHKNVVLIQGFKEYCALLFFKGALLSDPDGILVKPGENTQAARQIRFFNDREIDRMKSMLKRYIGEAIEVEKAGLKVKLKEIGERPIPEEFQNQLKKHPALKAAFNGLTPGRQRAYLLHFASAKQSKTRASRVNQCIPQILKGMGLDD